VSRRCNLACAHCYSNSGPGLVDELPTDLWHGVLDDAANAGFNVVGFSGGEPLMFSPLRDLLLHARRLNMITTVTTNGMLLDSRRIQALSGAASLVAISLDGTPEAHNQMRGHPRAFSTMARRLSGLRAAGIPFGFIFTLTQFNLDQLLWAAEFAVAEGARLLQVHPLEAVGRANDSLAGAVPDAAELAYAVLVVARLRELLGSDLKIQLDVAGRDTMENAPETVFATENWPAVECPLGELISPLIVEADGTVVPVEYAFGRRWTLGNLRNAPLSVLAQRWKRDCLPHFRAMCVRVRQEAIAPDEPAVINWYSRIAKESVRAQAAFNPTLSSN
jgi:MoaA/NifB/PqqE/SkfB family radical SAM enzyme